MRGTRHVCASCIFFLFFIFVYQYTKSSTVEQASLTYYTIAQASVKGDMSVPFSFHLCISTKSLSLRAQLFVNICRQRRHLHHPQSVLLVSWQTRTSCVQAYIITPSRRPRSSASERLPIYFRKGLVVQTLVRVHGSCRRRLEHARTSCPPRPPVCRVSSA